MALDPVKNLGLVKVSTGYDEIATSIVLTTGHGARLPDPATDGAFNLAWWNSTDYPDPAGMANADANQDPNYEIVRCTARTTDTLTITRAQEGTAASTKNTTAKVYKMTLTMTKKMKDDIENHPLTTKGDIPAFSTKKDRLPVGTNAQVLTADSAQSLGVKWANPSGGASMNVQTLTGNKTLTVGTDKIYQYLNPNNADRIITLDTTGAVAGDRFVIRNTQAFDFTNCLTIMQSTTELDKFYSGVIKEFIFDGTNWISGSLGTGENDNKKYNLAIGYYAKGYEYGTGLGSGAIGCNQGVAVGYNAAGNNWGAAVGHSADGYSRGAAIGGYAQGSPYGVGIGYYARTGGKYYSICLGCYSQSYREGETSINIDGVSGQYRNAVQGRWTHQTADATQTEIFCAGRSATTSRFNVRPTSHMVFKGLVVARNNAANEGMSWEVKGMIKRDGAGNTVIVGTVSITEIAKDGTLAWSVAIDADDTNEALRIKVTGEAAKTIRWGAVLDGVEVIV